MQRLILNFLFVLWILISFVSHTGWGKDVHITTVGIRRKLYNHGDILYRNQDALSSLAEGDTLILEWESPPRFLRKPQIFRQSFRVGRLLGQGNTTSVYELPEQPGRVLRIPSSWVKRFGHAETYASRFLDSMAEGEKALVEAGVPLTRLFDYQRHLFIVAEKVEGPTLRDFLTMERPMDFALREKMTRELERFALQVAAFAEIGDFRPEQLTYDLHRSRWVLHDWTGYSYLAGADSKRNPFRSREFLEAIARYRPEVASSPRVQGILKRLDELIESQRTNSDPQGLRGSSPSGRLAAHCGVLLESRH